MLMFVPKKINLGKAIKMTNRGNQKRGFLFAYLTHIDIKSLIKGIIKWNIIKKVKEI